MKFKNIVILALGTVSVGSAAVFIVLSGVDPAGVAVWRLGVTAAVFLPLAAPRLVAEISALSTKARLAMVLAGIAFGLHFVLFNTGFEYTSYESTVVLIAAQPITAAVLGYVFLREKVNLRMAVSIVIGTVGLVILVWNDYTFRPEHLVGDAIVLACVLAIVVTYVFARRLRQVLSYPVFVFCLFSTATVTAWVYLLIDGQRLFHSDTGALGWACIGVLILVCTILGHTSFNYVTKWVPLFYTNIVIISEPVLAIVLKYALRSRFEVFRESDLTLLQIVGGAVMALGIVIGFAGKRKREGDPKNANSGIEGSRN
ncbi:MAG: DMT family transporter [Planctomycetota bacterium]